MGDEPNAIIEAKARLKSTKKVTTQIEQISKKLYLAQKAGSKQLSSFCDQLTSVHIENSDDKFAIFLNNMGRVQQNLEEVYLMYLINMKDQLLNPLNQLF